MLPSSSSLLPSIPSSTTFSPSPLNNLLLFNSPSSQQQNKYLNSLNLLQSTIQTLNFQLILDQQRQQLIETIKYFLQKREEEEKEKYLFKKQEEIKNNKIINLQNEEFKNKQKLLKNEEQELIKNNKLIPKEKLKRKRKRQEIETDSPVSGMFIKDFCDEEELRKTAKAAKLQLDDSASFVKISEGARKAIALIPDVIGDSKCALCKIKFEDVFRLAMHKCPRIQHEEYKCKECEKVWLC
ncbi:unnamed protein product [Meloidogyne enterolobii]|uniref:Uncharacterized protein n=1 Tax=Meloidogyne enterolobii TaxID=390850 RepID=A0ACB0XXY1_MELEN